MFEIVSLLQKYLILLVTEISINSVAVRLNLNDDAISGGKREGKLSLIIWGTQTRKCWGKLRRNVV